MPRFARRASLAALVVVLGWAAHASGYVRYRAQGGVEFAWPDSCVFITSYIGDFDEMPAEEVQNAVNGAVNVWSQASNACTYLTFNVTFSPGPAPPRVLARDRRNVILFRTESWCALDDRNQCDPTDPNYGPEALALTTVSAVTSTGEIRDVDIEVNAVWHDWADLVAHPDQAAGNAHDLQNALTHELGHLIGLDHTCFPPNADPPIPLDHEGLEIPFCGDSAPAAVKETTMYNSAPSGETEKRSLAPDDQLAMCEIYPTAANPVRCAPPSDEDSGCGCALGRSGSPAAGALAMLVLAAALLAARRRRAR